MIFWIPDPTLWTDPGPIRYNRVVRGLWRKFYPFFPTTQAWVDQWRVYLDRLQREEEAYLFWLDQVREQELIAAEYQAQGEYWADRLPVWLHKMKLSRIRTVQDRKDSRPYEKVDYVLLEQWFFDEYAYYFWVNTWDLPYGVTLDQFEPNAEDGRVALTLTGAFGTNVDVEFNSRTHQRPGLWIVAEHKAGRGGVPNYINFQKLFSAMPKGASPLAWPVGMSANKRMLIEDLSEIYHLGIGGQTGGGKSNNINVLLGSFLSRNAPQELRLFLVDFKRVELAYYKGLPHLGGDVSYVKEKIVISDDDDEEEKDTIDIKTLGEDEQPTDELHGPLGRSVVTDGRTLLKLLDYILSEIYRRTRMLEGRVKKIEQWNNRFPRKKLSQWVLIIDELGDVMLQPGINRKVERKLVRIMQLGRAMGIRCVLATQTPKSEVITSLIQNNLTAWMVFRTGTGVASGLMLDGKYDAAKLPAIPGRAIFRQGGTMVEVQTPEITDLTIRKIVRMAKHGQLEQVSETQTIAPEQIFKYALSELSGYCSVSDIFKHFRKEGASKSELRQILQDYTVAGSPPALEPEIEINGEFYYLTPFITGSKNPRQLMKTDKFIAEFDRFAPYMGNGADTVHGSQSAENGDTPQAETAKIEETQEIVEALPERGLFDE